MTYLDIRGLTLPELHEAVPGSKVLADVGGHRPNSRNGRSGLGFVDYHGDRDWLVHGDLDDAPTWVPASWVTNSSAPEVEVLAIGRGRPVRTKPDGSRQKAACGYLLVKRAQSLNS
jgi:hypothetical protein